MYAEHYGFREKPFALSPDPRYLFLSASHREVLGHLVYGIEQGEGFMAISGEVGTGKTTLCRTLLERLGSSCEIAFLFNPTLDPTDLIKAINGEFGLSTFGDSRAELLDVLNTFLLDRHAEGRRVLVIIDEAQNLPVPTLEQLRLLSNLETHTAKLLQIVLIGQPELDAKLDAPELRQLRQRIGVWWRLGPLQPDETREYVEHRLRVAGCQRPIFTRSALALVHRQARGVPRLVNLLCDRALLRGYAEGAAQVSRAIVHTVAEEIGGPKRPVRRRRIALLGGSLGILALLGAAFWLRGTGRPGERATGGLAPVSLAPAPSRELPDVAPRDTFESDLLADLAPERHAIPGDDVLGALLSLHTAEASLTATTQAALSLWQRDAVPPIGHTLDVADEALRTAGLTTLRLEAVDLERLRAIDLPALLEFEQPDGSLRFGLLRRLRGARADLEGVVPGQSVRIETRQLERHWSGVALVPWQDFAGLPDALGPDDSGASVTWVQDALARLDYYAGPPDGRYDRHTREAVEAFQRDAGIEPDGRIGSLTKLALYRALPDYALPMLATPAALPVPGRS